MNWDVVADPVNFAAAVCVLVAMGLMLARLIGGPTLYDRLLAVNGFGTKTVLFLCVFCFLIDRPDGIDIAILYALMNFIATIAVLKFFRYRALGVGLENAHITDTTLTRADPEEADLAPDLADALLAEAALTEAALAEAAATPPPRPGPRFGPSSSPGFGKGPIA